MEVCPTTACPYFFAARTSFLQRLVRALRASKRIPKPNGLRVLKASIEASVSRRRSVMISARNFVGTALLRASRLRAMLRTASAI